MDLNLKDKRVLVTASSEGLGFATAQEFINEGARVIICGRDKDKLEQALSQLNGEAYAVQCDITQPDELDTLYNYVNQYLGGLDILVTNVGGPPAGQFSDVSLDDWQDAVNRILMSAVRLIQLFLPLLKSGQSPSILSIASVSAKEPVNNLVLSNVIRPTLLGLTNHLSRELGEFSIRINCILPGPTDTARIKALVSYRADQANVSEAEIYQQFAEDIPLQRIGLSEEFAKAAVFISSPAASFINGVAIPVDGGLLQSI